jgi:chemotaxis protein CheD
MIALPCSSVFLRAGDFYFGRGDVQLRTLLGTCVSVALWHPKKRIGGMCHYLLPSRGRADGAAEGSAGLYADEVFGLFDLALKKYKTEPGDYIVKVFGGGNMFPRRSDGRRCSNQACGDTERRACALVGCQNVSAAHRLLQSGGYHVAAEDVGGEGSRQIVFDLSNGSLWLSHGAAMESI